MLLCNLGRRSTNITETLNNNFSPAKIHSNRLSCFLSRDNNTSTSRFNSPKRTTQIHWLSGHTSRNGVTLLHGNGIHDPRHNLAIGTNVWCWDIRSFTQNDANFGRISSGELLNFAQTQLFSIDFNRALSSTIRNINNGALPRHPHRKRCSFMNVNINVIPNPTLRWSSRRVVLDSITLEAHNLTIVHNNWEIDHQLAHRMRQHLMQSRIKIKIVCRDS